MKNAILREEDAADEKMWNPTVAAAVNRRAARVPAGGGDAMSGGLMAILAGLEQEAADRGMTLEELAAEQEVHGALAQADQSDKELDRSNASTLPAPADVPDKDGITPAQYAAANVATEAYETEQENLAQMTTTAVLSPTFNMPPAEYMRKGQHYKLVFQGVCSHCAHCAMQLTDSVSIERGLGPVCSKRGYLEDPTDPDEIQAMIDLAEYPDLVNYLVEKYKPQGVRGLMNGLVKICSLNRKSPVHQACCDAVESLGYKKLASTLRESLAVIEIKEEDVNTYNVWVKKSEWNYSWQIEVTRLPGAYKSFQKKGLLVPKKQKQMLWALMIKHFEGLCATVRLADGEKKTVKITPVVKAPDSSPAS